VTTTDDGRDTGPETSPDTRPPEAPAHAYRAIRRPVVMALVALAVALVAIAVYAVTRPVKVWDRSTPAGTVQAYVTAVLDGDTVAAAGLFAADSPCAATDLDRAVVPGETRVDLIGTDVQGTQAQVRVRVVVDPGADPLGGGGEERTFRLTRTGAGWRIDGIPWPLYDCSGG